MTNLKVTELNSSRIQMKHNYRIGWFFIALGLGIASLPQLGADMQGNNWAVYLFAALLIFFGLLAAYYRFEVLFDLVSRRYMVTRGVWPMLSIDQGHLDELEGLRYEKLWRRSNYGNGNITECLFWVIGIRIQEKEKPIFFYESLDEGQARQHFEELASLLKIRTVDHTGENEEIRNWDELDATAISQLSYLPYDPVDLESPPPELSFQREDDSIAYWTAAQGFNRISLALGLVAALSLYKGLPVLLLGIGNFEGGFSLTRGLTIFFGILFILIGLGAIKLSLGFALRRYRVRFSQDGFSYTSFVRNKQKTGFHAAWNEIERFYVRSSTFVSPDPSSHNTNSTSSNDDDTPIELYIRSHNGICTVRHLEQVSIRFLYNAFYQLLEESQREDKKMS